MIPAADQIERKSDGIVRYTYDVDNDIITAKWLSSRTVDTGLTGTGTAFRTAKGQTFEGGWEITYYDPDGALSWHPFALKISKDNEIFYATWSTLEGDRLLSGFGFLDGTQLYIRYGTASLEAVTPKV